MIHKFSSFNKNKPRPTGNFAAMSIHIYAKDFTWHGLVWTFRGGRVRLDTGQLLNRSVLYLSIYDPIWVSFTSNWMPFLNSACLNTLCDIFMVLLRILLLKSKIQTG